jgi:hypothetical protein
MTPFVFGMPELKAVLLAHAIILAVAVVRYVVLPRWGGRRDAYGALRAWISARPRSVR